MYFERGQKVRLRIGVHRPVVVDAVVLVDLGGETVIVARKGRPNTAKRAPRARLMVPRQPPTPKRAAKDAAPEATATREVYCATSTKGSCALQRQASPPARAEMAEGVFTVCGEWVTSRSKPDKSEPSCVDCRRLLKL